MTPFAGKNRQGSRLMGDKRQTVEVDVHIVRRRL
jgi:hypothetical protein